MSGTCGMITSEADKWFGNSLKVMFSQVSPVEVIR